jgi:hypothetical protein
VQERIRVNAAECRKCGDYIRSTHRHDYVTCKCGAISVDGGTDYLKRSATDYGDIIERSEHYADVDE